MTEAERAEQEAAFESWWIVTHSHIDSDHFQGLARNIVGMTKVIAKESWMASHEYSKPTEH